MPSDGLTDLERRAKHRSLSRNELLLVLEGFVPATWTYPGEQHD